MNIGKKICFDLIGKRVKLKPYAKELFTFLKTNCYRICLASSAARDSADRILYDIPSTNFLGEDIFELILTSVDVKNLKPAPDIYLKILKTLNMKAEDAIVIEDSLVGLNADLNASIDVIIVSEEHNKDADIIKQEAPFYVESLEDIYSAMQKRVDKCPKVR